LAQVGPNWRQTLWKWRELTGMKFARLLPLLNFAFWLGFGALFVAQSYPYQPHRLAFEEITPSYIFFGRALREIDSGTGVALPPALMNVTYAIQKPSVLATKSFYCYFNSRGIVVSHLFWGISVGGYYLLVVSFFSFLQWLLIGFFVDTAYRRLSRHA
jgi:hypothetical protein